MLPRRGSLRCSTRGRWQSLPLTSGIEPRRFFEPKTCVSSSHMPLEWCQVTKIVRPLSEVSTELVPEVDLTHDAGRQLGNVGKVIRKIIQEVVDKCGYGVEDRLTLALFRTRDQNEDMFSKIAEHPVKALPRGLFLRQHPWQNWLLSGVRSPRRWIIKHAYYRRKKKPLVPAAEWGGAPRTLPHLLVRQHDSGVPGSLAERVGSPLHWPFRRPL